MAVMKNHSFCFNVEDRDQQKLDHFCESLKSKKQLSSYIRQLIIKDLESKNSGGNQT